jgi:hypothetical protein
MIEDLNSVLRKAEDREQMPTSACLQSLALIHFAANYLRSAARVLTPTMEDTLDREWNPSTAIAVQHIANRSQELAAHADDLGRDLDRVPASHPIHGNKQPNGKPHGKSGGKAVS